MTGRRRTERFSDQFFAKRPLPCPSSCCQTVALPTLRMNGAARPSLEGHGIWHSLRRRLSLGRSILLLAFHCSRGGVERTTQRGWSRRKPQRAGQPSRRAPSHSVSLLWSASGLPTGYPWRTLMYLKQTWFGVTFSNHPHRPDYDMTLLCTALQGKRFQALGCAALHGEDPTISVSVQCPLTHHCDSVS